MTQPTRGRQACLKRVRRGAIGILRRGATYLMVRRAPGVAKGGFWCFPGGHVEPGENSRRAVQREFEEELGIQVEPGRRLGVVRLLDSGYVLAVWSVRYVGGELCLAEDEIAEARWVNAQGIRTVSPGIPSNQRVVEMLGV